MSDAVRSLAVACGVVDFLVVGPWFLIRVRQWKKQRGERARLYVDPVDLVHLFLGEDSPAVDAARRSALELLLAWNLLAAIAIAGMSVAESL